MVSIADMPRIFSPLYRTAGANVMALFGLGPHPGRNLLQPADIGLDWQDVQVLPKATTRDEWLTYLGCAVLIAVLGAWIAFGASESQTTATGVVTAGGHWVDCHVEFRDREGVRHEFTQNQAGSKGSGILPACTLEAGQRTTVYYDLADPGNAGLAAPEKERTLGVMFVALGIGAVSYILFRLRDRGAASQTRKPRQRF